MKAILLAAVLLGCVTTQPVAPPPPPPKPAPVVDAPKLTGRLLVLATGSLMICRTGCQPLSDPKLVHPAHPPRRVGSGRYLFPDGVLDLRDESRAPIGFAPPDYGALWALDDGRFVLIEHLATEDRLRFAKGAFQESIPPKSYDFHFLGDGRHLFKTAPKIGKDESNFFTDVIEGQTVTLSYVAKPGGEPKKLAARSQFLHPDFVNDGSTIVYWAPGHVDEKKNERRMQLEAVDVATGNVTGLGMVTSPAIVESSSGSHYWRETPMTHHYVHSRFVVHGAQLDAAARPHAARVVDVTSGSATDVPLAEGEELLGCFSTSHAYYGGVDGRRDDDVLILGRREEAMVHVRVLALPTLAPLFSVTFPSLGPMVADFVRDP